MTLPDPVTLPSPCKLNLTLDVGKRRDDGFHTIDSLVVPLPPADEITVTAREGAPVVRLIAKDKRPDTLAHPPLPKGAENIAHQAATRFREAFLPDFEATIWVNLTKRLPLQAGLGAGSANAATVLRALGQVFGVSRDQLLPLAAALGSDVALFLYEGAVRLQGRGEVVTPVDFPLPPLYGVLVRPASGVPTGPAYAALDALTNRVPSTATEHLLQCAPATTEELATLLHNDFEQAVLPAFPDVKAAHEAVRQSGALRALLCGSGSAVFGLARDNVHALDLTRQLATKFPWVKLVKEAR